jgi:hypothetical protein
VPASITSETHGISANLAITASWIRSASKIMVLRARDRVSLNPSEPMRTGGSLVPMVTGASSTGCNHGSSRVSRGASVIAKRAATST